MSARASPHPRPFRTRFLRRRTPIPAAVRKAQVRTLDRAELMAASYRSEAGRARAASIKALRHLWEVCDTSFAAFDVEALDPCVAAADARPLGWNECHAPTVVPGISALGAAVESG